MAHLVRSVSCSALSQLDSVHLGAAPYAQRLPVGQRPETKIPAQLRSASMWDDRVEILWSGAHSMFDRNKAKRLPLKRRLEALTTEALVMRRAIQRIALSLLLGGASLRTALVEALNLSQWRHCCALLESMRFRGAISSGTRAGVCKQVSQLERLCKRIESLERSLRTLEAQADELKMYLAIFGLSGVKAVLLEAWLKDRASGDRTVDKLAEITKLCRDLVRARSDWLHDVMQGRVVPFDWLLLEKRRRLSSEGRAPSNSQAPRLEEKAHPVCRFLTYGSVHTKMKLLEVLGGWQAQIVAVLGDVPPEEAAGTNYAPLVKMHRSLGEGLATVSQLLRPSCCALAKQQVS